MKQLSIIVISAFISTALFAQKAKLDEHYKSKKTVYTLPEKSTTPQVTSKEAMKMEVVSYNRTIDPAHMSHTKHPKFMALSPKEQMKKEVVKINNRPVQKDSSDVAIYKTEKENADIVTD